MTQTKLTPHDHVSVLMDGELHGDELQASIVALLGDAKGREAWHVYHLVGDILRSDELAAAAHDLQFLAKLEKRLSTETLTHLVAMPEKLGVLAVDGPRQNSANSERFRWRMVAGGVLTITMAALAIFVVEPNAWQVSVPMAAVPPKILDARIEVAATAVSADGMIRDPRLDQFLSAHQQLGGHSALEMPSGFLRNATYDGKGR